VSVVTHIAVAMCRHQSENHHWTVDGWHTSVCSCTRALYEIWTDAFSYTWITQHRSGWDLARVAGPVIDQLSLYITITAS